MHADGADRRQLLFGKLTGILHEIAELTGDPESALAVARTFGRKRLYIPRTITADHPLAQLIGFAAACQLAAKRGRERWKIPSGKATLTLQRVFKLLDRGLTAAEIAGELQLDPSQVRRILKSLGPAVRAAPASPAKGDALAPIRTLKPGRSGVRAGHGP